MDASYGYNQILMHPDNQEKTSFITERGLYCYKVMHFRLKNAGATYQHLVNTMLSEQLRKILKVYIDDMLVKSLYSEKHIAYLAECFSILQEYKMKLNTHKCSFGVQSDKFFGYLVPRRGIEANPE